MTVGLVSRSMADSQVPCPAGGFSVQQPVVDRTRLGLQLGQDLPAQCLAGDRLVYRAGAHRGVDTLLPYGLHNYLNLAGHSQLSP